MGGDVVSFDLERDESRGTIQAFRMALPVLRAAQRPTVLIIDELDASLHPRLARAVVQAIQRPRAPNEGSQVVFTTHDVTLLDETLLRRDQICLVEKDEHGASRLVPLATYRPRKGEALAKGYLKGRYGAVPIVGDLAAGS